MNKLENEDEASVHGAARIGPIKKLIVASQKFKSIALLLGSNVFATLTLAAGTFFIAKIISPEEFGRYSLAAQVAVSIYPVLTLRYEHALPLMGKRHITTLYIAGCLLLLFISTLLLLTLGVIGISIPTLSAYLPKDIVNLAPLVGLVAFTLALSSIYQSAALAKGALSHLAIARIIRAVTMVTIQILLALSLGASATWLLIGEISANFVQFAILATAFGLSGVLASYDFSSPRFWQRLIVLGRRYKEFPLFTLPHTISHSILGLLFATILGTLYGAAALGQYYLMRKLVFGVLALFSMAIYQHAIAEAAHLPTAKLFRVAMHALVMMGSAGVVSAGVILVVGPDLFALAVGDKWIEAGFMAIASVPLILLEPLTSILAFLPVFLGHQRIAFAVAVVQGSVGIAAIGIAGWLGWDVIMAIAASSMAMSSVMLAFILWLLMRAQKAKSG